MQLLFVPLMKISPSVGGRARICSRSCVYGWLAAGVAFHVRIGQVMGRRGTPSAGPRQYLCKPGGFLLGRDPPLGRQMIDHAREMLTQRGKQFIALHTCLLHEISDPVLAECSL
jgi:hypothetical protein